MAASGASATVVEGGIDARMADASTVQPFAKYDEPIL